MNYNLTVDRKLLEDLNLESIYDYPYTYRLINKIFSVLPSPSEIFEEFL